MNGIESIEAHWKSKEHHLKKSYRMKLLLMLLITNIIVYCISACQTSKALPVKSNWYPFKSAHHKKIIIQTKIYLDTTNISTPMAITILNNNNKIIIRKAWLHSIKISHNNLNDLTTSRIEILSSDLSKIVNTDEQSLKILPYFTQAKIINKNKRKYYELIF
ncbi:MAG: hypothetical protein HN576_15220 [Bacteriovoracaceae bacterium]|jgi:hypothetical protein|nr:hypothetical protein [Bacteriovoracaceae bacterium]